jgi:hypothetical protein
MQFSAMHGMPDSTRIPPPQNGAADDGSEMLMEHGDESQPDQELFSQLYSRDRFK